MGKWRTTQHDAGNGGHIRGHLIQQYYQSETHGFMEARIDLGNGQRRHAFAIFDAPESVRNSADVRDLFRRDAERAEQIFPADLKEGVNYVPQLQNMDHYAFTKRVPENIRNAIENGSDVQEAIKLGTLAEFGITGDVAKTFADELSFGELADHLLESMPDGPPRTSGEFGSDYERPQTGRVTVAFTSWNGSTVGAPIIDSRRATNILAGASGVNIDELPSNVSDACVIKLTDHVMA